MTHELDGGQFGIGDFHALGIFVFIQFGAHRESGGGGRCRNQLNHGSKAASGFPRQLSVIENRRCSILFHWLVPGGRWQTVMGIRNSFASLCSSIFHRRRRWSLLPPPSAVIIRRLALG